nr:hypothetical protein [Endozoicomonas sp.]
MMTAITFLGNTDVPAPQLQNELNGNSSFDMPIDLAFGFIVVGCVVALLYLKHSGNRGHACHLGSRLCQRIITGVKDGHNQLMTFIKGGGVVNDRVGSGPVSNDQGSSDQDFDIGSFVMVEKSDVIR